MGYVPTTCCPGPDICRQQIRCRLVERRGGYGAALPGQGLRGGCAAGLEGGVGAAAQPDKGGEQESAGGHEITM